MLRVISPKKVSPILPGSLLTHCFTTLRSDCSVALIGVNEDRNSSFMRGPRKAPSIIRDFFKSDSSNSFSELGINVADKIVDFGDFEPAESDSTSILESLEDTITKAIRANHIPLFLGGDHSISFPICKLISKLHKAPFVIFHFDAHPDIYPAFGSNDGYGINLSSHASPFSRILEQSQHIDDKLNICSHLVSIGIRTINDIQKLQIEKYKSQVSVVEARFFPFFGGDIMSRVPKHASASITEDTPVYVSIDMDVLEPGLSPGVSHREPGGLSVRQLIDAIHALPGRIIGGDIVEYNPDRDVDGITGEIAAKLMKELASKAILTQSK